MCGMCIAYYIPLDAAWGISLTFWYSRWASRLTILLFFLFFFGFIPFLHFKIMCRMAENTRQFFYVLRVVLISFSSVLALLPHDHLFRWTWFYLLRDFIYCIWNGKSVQRNQKTFMTITAEFWVIIKSNATGITHFGFKHLVS